jgi:hypothetical protein
MKKTALVLAFILAFFLSALAGTIHFGTVQAESSITNPSIPEFTVKFVNASYSVTTTDPYTGINETQQISNNSIEITIKNQPFDYSNGYRIYFNVRTKPHFEGNWTEIYYLENLTSSYNADGSFSFAEYVSHDSPPQSNSSYTNITFPVVPTELYQASGYDIQRYYTEVGVSEGMYFAFLSAIPYGGQVDFQVEALVGHDSQRWYIAHPFFPTIGGQFLPAVAYESTSGWSNTQTLLIPAENAILPSDDGTTSDGGTQQIELYLFVLGLVIMAIVVLSGVGLVLYFKKHKH